MLGYGCAVDPATTAGTAFAAGDGMDYDRQRLVAGAAALLGLWGLDRLAHGRAPPNDLAVQLQAECLPIPNSTFR
jgi:hypothetical protein